MEYTQFEQQMRADAPLSALVHDAAMEIRSEGIIEQSGQYVVGVDDIFIGLAAYALFRWAKDYFDYKRAQSETEIAERRARIVAGLVADGFEPEKAQAVTEGLLKQIAKRADDDPVLQKAVALIGTGGG